MKFLKIIFISFVSFKFYVKNEILPLSKMAGSGEKLNFMYDEESAKPKSEDYLLGKAIDANFERAGTMGQINAVEYGMYFIFSEGFNYIIYVPFS